jgi:hypothetical protein
METSDGINVHEDEYCSNSLSVGTSRKINYVLKPAGMQLNFSSNISFPYLEFSLALMTRKTNYGNYIKWL